MYGRIDIRQGWEKINSVGIGRLQQETERRYTQLQDYTIILEYD